MTWTQIQKPNARFVIGMMGAMLIGVGMGNVGAGIALGVALGVPGYVSGKKEPKDDKIKTSDDK